METEFSEDGTRPADLGTTPADRTEMHPELTYDGPIDREACDRLLRIIHRLDGIDEAYESTGSERRESRSSRRYERYRKTVLDFLAEAGRRAARAAVYLASVHDEARADGIDFGDGERDGVRMLGELKWLADCCDRAVRAAEEGRTGGLLYAAAVVRHVRRAWWRVTEVERAGAKEREPARRATRRRRPR